MATITGFDRKGEVTISLQDGKLVASETYEVLVRADDKYESRLSIATAPGSPIPGQTISASGLGVCKSYEGTQDEDVATVWRFTAVFSTEVDEQQSSSPEADTDPTEWVPVYAVSFERITVHQAEDAAGAPIVNSAKQPFARSVAIPKAIAVWRFTQYDSDQVTDDDIMDQHNTVNSGVFKGRAAKTLLLNVASSSVGYHFGRRLRKTEYVIKYNPDTWKLKRRDVGTAYLAGGVLMSITADDGVTVVTGNLDGAGGKQAAGVPPATLEFDIYPTSSFSFLRT